MSSTFKHDIFMSYSSEDWRTAERLAKRLRNDGVKVWLDRWVIKAGDDIYASVEEGLHNSRVLVQILSRASLGSEWVIVERNTTLFRDPHNRERRFVPVIIDKSFDKIPDTVKRLKHISMARLTTKAYDELLQACGIKKANTPV